MNIFEKIKKFNNRVKYYDKISPKPFTRGYSFNPFSFPRKVTVVWINKDNEFENYFKRLP